MNQLQESSESRTSSLSVRNITKTFPTADQPLKILDSLSLELSAGDSMAIVGPSGSGKSTLLHLIGTLDHPDSGEIEIDEVNPFSLNEKQLADFRCQHIGFIFQDHHLLPQLTVIENVLIPALASGSPREQDYSRAESLLEQVGLNDRRGHLPGELSGGERERVAIARALLMHPSLVLADEPTGNLDRRTADAVTDLLLNLQSDSGVILITVTHSETLAAAMNQRRELQDGKLI